MAWCLIKKAADNLLTELKEKRLTYASLRRMSSDKRRAVFEKLMSVDDAKRVNILFEKKLLQKDFFRSMDAWVSTVTGVPTKRMAHIKDMIAKRKADSLKKLFNPKDDTAFLKDLAEAKAGVGVTADEARIIWKMTNAARDTESPGYGEARTMLENFIGDVKIEARGGGMTTAEYWKSVWKDGEFNPAQLGRIVVDLAGAMKSVVASIDQSFIGQQGARTLLAGNYSEWAKMAKNSLETAYKVATLPGEQVIDGKTVKIAENSIVKDGVKAGIYNRPNGRNGGYEKMKLAVGITEEAFPSSIPSKIPGLGRFFKASEESYTAAAYMLRADLADKYIKEFPEILEDKKMAESFGKMINSLTGRGDVGIGKLGTVTNTALFSPKFIQSSLDILTAHTFDQNMTSQAKKIARMNLVKIIASTAGIAALAQYLYPGSVEKDPRSSDFGKVRIGDTRYDYTAGLSGYVTLFSRLRGSKSATTGAVTKPGEYGSKDIVGSLADFVSGKASPFARLITDIAKGQNFDGDPMSPKALAEDPHEAVWVLGKSFMPISTKQFYDALKDGDEVIWSSVITGFFGIGSNTYTYSPNWDNSTSKELAELKEKIGKDEFRKANKEFATTVNNKLGELRANKEYQDASDAEKKAIVSRIQNTAKEETFKKYDFKPTKSKTSDVVEKLSK